MRFDSAPRTDAIRDRRGYPNLKGLPLWILQLFAARKAASKPPSGLKGAIDAPDPYALMATGARNSAAPAIEAEVVSEEDFAEISADEWLEMAGVHVHAGVREVIEEAYWEKVGPMGHTQTLPEMFADVLA